MNKKIIILIISLLLYSFVFSQNYEYNKYHKAISEIHYKRYNNAKEILEKLILTNNREINYYIALGDCYYEQKIYDEAINQYKEAKKQKSKIANYKIAECYSILNKPSLSVEYLKEYLKSGNKLLKSQIRLNPKFENINSSKAWINLWKENHYSKYEKELDEVRFLISKEDYVNAFQMLDLLIIKNKKKHKAHELRGDLLMILKDYKNAGKSYSQATEIKNKNYNYSKKAAEAFYSAKKYKKAEKYCIDAINKNPFEIDLYILKTKIEYSKKDFNNAENYADYYLQFYPDNNEVLNLSGLISHNKKEYIKALEKYNICIQSNNPIPEYYINRAETYMAVSMYENAKKDLSMALDLNPKLAEVYYKRGITYLKTSNNKEACLDFNKALSMGYYKASDYIFKHCK